MPEETRVTIKEHPTVQGIKQWAVSVVTVVVLGVVAYSVFLVRQYVPLVGYIVIISLAVLPAIGLIAAITWLVKYITHAEAIEIGPSGTVIRWLGRVTPIHPLGVQEHRTAGSKDTKVEAEVEIPTLLALLKERVIGGGELLLGYHKDGTARYGLWGDLKTFIVAGKSRSGKTVTMVFIIIQALLGGAQVWVCDPHYNKRSGLLKVLEPLIPYMRVARTTAEIVTLALDFAAEMKQRERNTSEMGNTEDGYIPIVLVYDEWTKLLRDLDNVEQEIVVNSFLDCAEAYADFEGYAVIAGHEWTARESGGKKGAAVRKQAHAAIVHRLDEDYAKFLLLGSRGKKAAKTAPNLFTGHAYLQDADGELDYLLIPFYGKNREAVQEARNMLLEREGVLPRAEYPQIEGPYAAQVQALSYAPVNGPVNGKQGVNGPVNGPVNSLQEETAPIYTSEEECKLTEELTPVNSLDVNGLDLKTLIERARKQGIGHGKIAATVGMNGRHYPQYHAFCLENNIPIEPSTGNEK